MYFSPPKKILLFPCLKKKKKSSFTQFILTSEQIFSDETPSFQVLFIREIRVIYRAANSRDAFFFLSSLTSISLRMCLKNGKRRRVTGSGTNLPVYLSRQPPPPPHPWKLLYQRNKEFLTRQTSRQLYSFPLWNDNEGFPRFYGGKTEVKTCGRALVSGCRVYLRNPPALELNSNSRVARVCTVNIVSWCVTGRCCVYVWRAASRARKGVDNCAEGAPGVSTAQEQDLHPRRDSASLSNKDKHDRANRLMDER